MRPWLGCSCPQAYEVQTTAGIALAKQLRITFGQAAGKIRCSTSEPNLLKWTSQEADSASRAAAASASTASQGNFPLAAWQAGCDCFEPGLPRQHHCIRAVPDRVAWRHPLQLISTEGQRSETSARVGTGASIMLSTSRVGADLPPKETKVRFEPQRRPVQEAI